MECFIDERDGNRGFEMATGVAVLVGPAECDETVSGFTRGVKALRNGSSPLPGDKALLGGDL